MHCSHLLVDAFDADVGLWSVDGLDIRALALMAPPLLMMVLSLWLGSFAERHVPFGVGDGLGHVVTCDLGVDVGHWRARLPGTCVSLLSTLRGHRPPEVLDVSARLRSCCQLPRLRAPEPAILRFHASKT